MTTTPNAVITARARESLQGQWGLVIGTFLIYGLILFCINIIPVVGGLIGLLLGGPFVLGYARFNLSVIRKDSPKIEQLFSGFKQIDTSIIANILMAIFIFLWMLLLIIPGFIAMYSYAMTFYIIAEDKNISASDAIKKSKAMMNGHKGRLFYLSCRFFGWFLLSILTCGIGLLWVIPYLTASYAHFYEDLKAQCHDELNGITSTSHIA